ncbi:MAG: hypothetical protein IJG13_10250 [Kiritimatiellae bacterium]|nr:hypothetical protein [Kiritimatiellia bacterium]MBQ3341469.1 hypothetical protein [Kiritimatiellia bacterium]
MRSKATQKAWLACALALPLACRVLAIDVCEFVDPFVGTSATGHTFPAACVPFGLVQAGPDTGNGNWDYCSGYRHGDKTICGFTQTHLNGTGCPDLGDIRIMPFCSTGFGKVGENSSSSRKDVKFHSPTQNSNSNSKKLQLNKLSELAKPGY